MALTPHLERKKAFRVTGDHEAPKKHRSASESHFGFASRIFTLFFKREPFADIPLSKSWSGQPNTAPVENLTRHSSVQTIAVSGSNSTAIERTARYTDHDDKGDSGWRKRQAHCVNCGRLFFVSLSTLNCDNGPFSSLDCRSTFEYVDHLEKLLAGHMLGGSIGSSSSSNEDDYAVEELNVENLLTDLQAERTSI